MADEDMVLMAADEAADRAVDERSDAPKDAVARETLAPRCRFFGLCFVKDTFSCDTTNLFFFADCNIG